MIVEGIASVFAFKSLPTTFLLVFVYGLVFSTVLYKDELASIPQNQRGFNLTEAFEDLHSVAARPHPFNSHANDQVRTFLLSRIQDITAGQPHIHIHDDLASSASWAMSAPPAANGSWALLGAAGVYFEGTNILVKIDGSNPEFQNMGGVLFSAHYDSVATAPGATDNGMGVVSILQMLKYLVNTRPERTTVFNFNNGEEDGLMGAHAYLEHPWSNITQTFFNVEGAASGGRPVLFRATSTSVLRHFGSQRAVPHPHGNVFAADAFKRGAVRSGTDYSVYTQGFLGRDAEGQVQMEGVDLAFYRGRSKYHTKYDSVNGMDEARKSLWAMMETVRGAGTAMVNNKDAKGQETVAEGDQGAVYFDLFNSVLILFSLRSLLTYNILLLVLGPALIILLFSCLTLVQMHRRANQNGTTVHVHHHQDSLWERGWKWFKDLGWMKGAWRWLKFWLALALSVLGLVALVALYSSLNPFIIYSHPYIVYTSFLTLTYVLITLTLKLPLFSPHLRSRPSLPEQQKLTALVQSYIFSWVLLIAATASLAQSGIGGLAYLTSAWNTCLVLGCTLGFVEGMLGAHGTDVEGGLGEERRRFVRGVRFEMEADDTDYEPATASNGHDNDDPNHEHLEAGGEVRHGVEVETEPTEITPLIVQRRAHPASAMRKRDEERGAIGWWIVQAFVVVPIPVTLVLHVVVMLLGAQAQTLADGNPPWLLYASVAALSLLTILPLAPFTFKLGRYLTYGVIILFGVTTAYCLLAFPFSQDTPLKVFFQQNVLQDYNNATMTLIGPKMYLERHIISPLPSSWGKHPECSDIKDGRRPGLWACQWDTSELMPVPGIAHKRDPKRGPSASPKYLSVNASRTSRRTARINLKGTNTRSCRLYFDQPISSFSVSGIVEMQQGYEIGERGLTEVRLWSRTWGREFAVDVTFKEQGPVSGKAACEWVEYASGSVGVEGRGAHGADIPAFEETLSFLPKWVVVSKAEDGLVEAVQPFAIPLAPL